MRRAPLLLLLIAGCQYVDQPKKVTALEHRLDAIAARVGELDGKAEDGDGHGDGDGHDDDDAHAAGKKAGKANKPGKAKADKTSRPRSKHADPPHEDAHGAEAAAAAHDAPAHAAPSAASGSHAAPHWSYQGDTGPAAWGNLDPSFATCASGEAQSPIDILPQRARPPEVFFVYQPTPGAVVDNGHTLQVDLERGSYAVVDGERFDLVQFHVHTPSEHTIAGDVYPLEVHLVHKNAAGALAVVGVLFAEGEASPALAPVWKAAPRGAGKNKLKKKLDPGALLPREQGAYRYDGSLTTPPCTEGVRWIVLRRTRTEDPARIAAVRDRFGGNARPVQELGARELR